MAFTGNKILVIGGFGYLGCIITDLFARDGNKVDVLDCCLWENKGVSGTIRYDNHLNFRLSSVDPKDFEKYDHVIWCCDIDVEGFYSLENVSDSINKNHIVFEELCKLKKEKFYYITDHRIHNRECTDMASAYINDIKFKHMVALENMSMVLYCSSLYGASNRMRWDTDINYIIFNSLVSNDIVLESGWLHEYPCCAVNSTANEIYNVISKGKCEEVNHLVGEIVSNIEVAHRVKIKMEQLETDRKYNIHANKYDFSKIRFSVENDFIETVSIEDSIIHMHKSLEAGMFPDFMSDKYNNTSIVANYMSTQSFARNIING